MGSNLCLRALSGGSHEADYSHAITSPRTGWCVAGGAVGEKVLRYCHRHITKNKMESQKGWLSRTIKPGEVVTLPSGTSSQHRLNKLVCAQVPGWCSGPGLPKARQPTLTHATAQRLPMDGHRRQAHLQRRLPSLLSLC